MPTLVRRQTAFSIDSFMLDRYADDTAGERRVWQECLRDAIKCARGKATACNSTREKTRAMEDAVDWFLSTRVHIGSFLWICCVLDLDPGRIRADLRDRLLQDYHG